MADTLASVMSSLSLDDIAVDAEGRVRIAHPELAKKIAELKGVSPAARSADSVNTGTCNNRGCFAPEMDELARRGIR